MIILAFNIIVAIILAIIDIKYLYSFEVSFICSMFIFFSSFKSMQKKVDSISKSIDDISFDADLSKKEKFFVGSRISFGLYRILSYIILGFCIVALINNRLFFIIPFLIGTMICSFALAFYFYTRKNLSS